MLYNIALCFTPGIGNATCRRLVDTFGSAETVFSLDRASLTSALGQTTAVADILNRTALPRAEKELLFCRNNNLRPIFYTEPDFPTRLLGHHTSDCPVLLYVQGSANLNPARSLAVVGTRRATPAGIENTADLVRQLQPAAPTIVSGLAYGIDTAAHRAAVDGGLPTIAVLGHGLDTIYPAANRRLAADILNHGGALVTEFPSGTAINPRLFPARNRIIAALSDATIVAEASEKGGALITAAISIAYGREVFAMPGRVSDVYSRGTNNLIANNQAILLRDATDVIFHLGWDVPSFPSKPDRQMSLFDALQPDEQHLLDILRQHTQLGLDELVQQSGFPLPKVAALVFNMEMQRAIRVLPGRIYQAADR